MEGQTLEEYISHITHELRSPLAVIQEAINLIIDGCDHNDPAKRLKILQIALKETKELNQRINEYLTPEKFKNFKSGG